MTDYVIAAEYSGGWVESYTLTEQGTVERIRYEGRSPEAERVREGAKAGSLSSALHEEQPRPPVAGQWVDELAEDLSEP